MFDQKKVVPTKETKFNPKKSTQIAASVKKVENSRNAIP
jgi:hypothetical protein